MAKKAKDKGFFALDIDQLFKIQSHDLGLEEAVTYLALMKSTDESNITSRGGINSVLPADEKVDARLSSPLIN